MSHIENSLIILTCSSDYIKLVAIYIYIKKKEKEGKRKFSYMFEPRDSTHLIIVIIGFDWQYRPRDAFGREILKCT